MNDTRFDDVLQSHVWRALLLLLRHCCFAFAQREGFSLYARVVPKKSREEASLWHLIRVQRKTFASRHFFSANLRCRTSLPLSPPPLLFPYAEVNYTRNVDPLCLDTVMIISSSMPLGSWSRRSELRIMQIVAPPSLSLSLNPVCSISVLRTGRREIDIAINSLTIAQLTAAFMSNLALTSGFRPARPSLARLFSQLWCVTAGQSKAIDLAITPSQNYDSEYEVELIRASKRRKARVAFNAVTLLFYDYI